MRFSTAVAFSTMALSAMAAPLPQENSTTAAAPGLLQDLSPEVAALLASLGLGGLSPPVGSIVSTAGADVKKRAFLDDLSPEVKDLLNRLGLSGLSPPVGDIVATAGKDVKKRALLDDLS
ncbi:hypothetical protein KCU75_g370, partial [Aureobasidium melanogenum]